jgi:SAM-dependent methyltransferase
VIGVDMTDEMLEVARRNAPVVAERIGYANVEFRKGRIQDLELDIELLDSELKARPVSDVNGYLAVEAAVRDLRRRCPLVATESVDVVVSNCVLNLVETGAKRQLFEEIFRVLKDGGRAVISDIVCDEEVPAHLQADSELWSECISGALTEEGFIGAFEEAGFEGIRILKRDVEPWRTVEGIEFRSVTVEAFKVKDGPCLDRNQAVIYKGPFKEVIDDGGHSYERGLKYAVCDRFFQLYQREPYAGYFEFIAPLVEVPIEEAQPFDCSGMHLRHPKETKGQDYVKTTEASSCCSGEESSSCCSDGGCC